MAFYRIYAIQDTSIADYDPAVPNNDPSYANIGASEIMNLYKWGANRSEVLIQFDSSSISSFPTGSRVFLRLANAEHSQSLPAGYNAFIRPLSQSWTEGDGFDSIAYKDLGAANFYRATANTNWAFQSGTASVTFSFITGREDLIADVTPLFVEPGAASYGFDVMIDPFYAGNAYIKKFHSRQSGFWNKRPYLEARWSDWTGSLSTTQAFRVTSGAYSGTLWPATMANSSVSSSGVLVTQYVSNVNPTGSIMATLFNLKPVFDRTEVVRLNLYVQSKDWNPATILTSSLTSTSAVLTECYYRVVDDVTDEEVVPFGTGSIPYTKLSYNDSGNYFDFNMSSLQIDTLYRFDFLYHAPTGSSLNGWNFIPGTAFKFRVTDVHG